jgi:hypothetical protein
MKKNNTEAKIIKQQTRTQDGAEYEYTLSVSKSNRVASYMLPLYSINVRMTHLGKTTEKCALDCFCDVGKALAVFDKLVKNLATPIDLPYVLEDKISV